MSSNSSTPTAKRRRAEAANATLRKPFRSPLITKKPEPGDHAENLGPEPSTPVLKGVSDESYVATYDNHARVRWPKERVSAEHRPVRRFPSVPESSRFCSDDAELAVSVGGRGLRVGAGAGAPLPERFFSVTAAQDEMSARGGGFIGNKEVSFLARLRRHREALHGVSVAEGEKASRTDRPGTVPERKSGGQNAPLEELVAKWKGASRMAAEELFDLIKERVDGMGGAKAWREMQAGRGRGFAEDDWDPGETRQKEATEGWGGGSQGETLDSEEMASASRKAESGDHDGPGGLNNDETVRCCLGTGRDGRVAARANFHTPQEFTMRMMLKSLNIEPELVGYDTVEEAWRD